MSKIYKELKQMMKQKLRCTTLVSGRRAEERTSLTDRLEQKKKK